VTNNGTAGEGKNVVGEASGIVQQIKERNIFRFLLLRRLLNFFLDWNERTT